MPIPKSLRIAVLRAYADCCGGADFEPESDRHSMRNLNFRSGVLLSRDDAALLMAEACPEGYNDFDTEVIRKLPAEARVEIAREHSVCLYVFGASLKACHAMGADECDSAGAGQVRLWWD